MATATTEDGMVVDRSEGETAEAKVAGGSCSQQKCNGGAPDQATDLHTPDGCGRGRSTTRSTTPGSGRGRLHRRRQVEILCSASSSTSSMTSGDGRGRPTSRMSSHARRWNRGRHTPSMEITMHGLEDGNTDLDSDEGVAHGELSDVSWAR